MNSIKCDGRNDNECCEKAEWRRVVMSAKDKHYCTKCAESNIYDWLFVSNFAKWIPLELNC